MITTTEDSIGKVPVFVVMNNRTLTVFGSQDFDSILASFDLKYMGFLKQVDDKGLCFGLYDEREKTRVIGLCIDQLSVNPTGGLV